MKRNNSTAQIISLISRLNNLNGKSNNNTIKNNSKIKSDEEDNDENFFLPPIYNNRNNKLINIEKNKLKTNFVKQKLNEIISSCPKRNKNYDIKLPKVYNIDYNYYLNEKQREDNAEKEILKHQEFENYFIIPLAINKRKYLEIKEEVDNLLKIKLNLHNEIEINMQENDDEDDSVELELSNEIQNINIKILEAKKQGDILLNKIKDQQNNIYQYLTKYKKLDTENKYEMTISIKNKIARIKKYLENYFEKNFHNNIQKNIIENTKY